MSSTAVDGLLPDAALPAVQIATVPVVPRADSITVRTGNIVNWNRLKRSSNQSASSELSECVNLTIKNWLEEVSAVEKLQGLTDVQCSNTKFLEKLPTEERQEYKITVKIFISNPRKAAIEDAVHKVLEELGVDSVETVILSVPEALRSYSDLRPLWEALEREVDAHRVYSLGISDLSKAQLEQLHTSVHVKPVINQVNLTTCCVIPQELSEFAKEHDVQLLTHNDPPAILSVEECQRLIGQSLTADDASSWQPYWVVRYSVLIKARGVIKTKGYIMRALKDLERT